MGLGLGLGLRLRLGICAFHGEERRVESQVEGAADEGLVPVVLGVG